MATEVSSKGVVNVNKHGVALQGYDPVSYFTQSKPQKGSDANIVVHDGTTYWFSSPEHKALFEQEPDKYTPQYGGFCAMAMSMGDAVDTDPTAYDLKDGKLYLNKGPLVNIGWKASRNVKGADKNYSSEKVQVKAQKFRDKKLAKNK